ncbi:hypothetical protein Z950_2600 [Sulfitobacter mediterraneus KCTC 32188]|nr:hypothetical protein Z950_2600 [Sulfitobacter mediterraneus KCTC 32188]
MAFWQRREFSLWWSWLGSFRAVLFWPFKPLWSPDRRAVW